MPQALSVEAVAAAAATTRPQLRWWWPGGAVEEGVLLAQLRAFHERGFGGVEIQPFKVGLPHHLPADLAAQVDDYATPGFFAKVAAVMAEAERLGMSVDLTFGSCWPFGGGEAITPELAATEVTLAWTSVHGPARYQGRPQQPDRPLRTATALERQGALPPHRHLPDGWAARIAAREQVVAVLAVKGSAPALGVYPGFVPISLPDAWGRVQASGWLDPDATIDLTDRLQADGQLDWQVPEGEWQLVVCKRFVIDQVLGESAGAGPQLVACHLNTQAFAAHARRVGEAAWPQLGAWAGGAWRAVFVDSLEIPADLHWCDDFEQEFERRRGYALRRYLPLLLHPGWRNAFQARKGPPLFDAPGVGDRVRADYRRTVSELMLERCYGPFADWADAHGLASRTQAHGAPVDWLEAYGLSSLPETEDLMGGAASGFLRVARSAAHLYGRPVVSAEAFVWLLEGLSVTPARLRARADALFAAGVQQIVGHGASYPLPLVRLARPGPTAPAADNGATAATWYPWQDMEFSTRLDPASSLWPHLGPLTSYLSRAQAAMRQGRADVPVAVLAPLDLFAFDSAGSRTNDEPWDQSLQDAGFDWNWMNADGLLRCRLENGHLLTPGGHAYEAVMLPPLTALRADVAVQLASWASEGLRVLALDAWPVRHNGLHHATAQDAALVAGVQALQRAGARCCPQARAGQALQALGLQPAWHWRAGPGTGLRFNQRLLGAQRLLCLHNPGAESLRATLLLQGAQMVERWCLWHGETRTVAHRNTAAGTEVDVLLPAGQAWWLCSRPAAEGASDFPDARLAGHSRSVGPEVPTGTVHTGRWTLTCTGHGLQGRPVALVRELTGLCNLAELDGLTDFAGLARCTTRVELAAALPAGTVLDLGEVRDTVAVSINGGPVSVCSEAPFALVLQQGLPAGTHELVLSVANVPENAMRDPEHPGGLPLPGRRLSRLPAGVLGPLQWRSAHTEEALIWRLTPLPSMPEQAGASSS